MRFWWVNHKQTYAHEVGGGYIWCPKLKRNGGRNHFYETLREVQMGDVIFSYAGGCLRAVGVAKVTCYSCPRPDEFGKVGDAWDRRGWRVDVGFQQFGRPLHVASVVGQLVNLLPDRYSPIQANGHGNQGAYLAEISEALAERLLRLAEPGLLVLLGAVRQPAGDSVVVADPLPLLEWEDRLQSQIENRLSIPETTRKALIHARRGQGRFKEEVARIERACRITQVRNPLHLIASHIKPWREASDEERLAGSNGLLLTPTIDHLFDRGYISFGDEGDVLISPVADHEALTRMGVPCDRILQAGKFNSDQKHFLEYHRNEIFLKSAI